MKKALQFLSLLFFNAAIAQHTVVRPYSYTCTLNLSDHSFMVTGSDRDSTYMEVFNVYGDLKDHQAFKLNRLNWLNSIFDDEGKIYWLYSSDGKSTSLLVFDHRLKLLNNYIMDSSYLFYGNNNASGFLFHKNNIYIVQKKKTGSDFYFNKYNKAGELVKSYLLNSDCFYFERQSFLVLGDNRLLLLNNCSTGYNAFLDTLGNLTRSYMIPTLSYNKTIRFKDNYIYLAFPTPSVAGQYCFQKYDLDENPIKRVCVTIPDSMDCYHAGWENSEDQFVPLGNDRFYYLDEVAYKVIYTDNYFMAPVYSMVKYAVDFYNEEIQLTDIRKRNYDQPSLLQLDNRQLLVYRRGNKEAPAQVYAYTYIEFPGSPVSCSIENFPNPATNRFIVKSDCLLNQRTAYVEMMDQMGRRVFGAEFPVNEDGECTISTNIPEGIYLCILTTGSGILCRKQAILGPY